MRRDARAVSAYPLDLSFDALFRNQCSVTVTVREGKRELDRFQASGQDVLRDALRPIFRHLDPSRQVVTFSGTEERWLPGGLVRSRREFALPNLSSAIAFLAN